jgi:WD40 repeat protein
VYDPTSGTFSPTGNLANPRSRHSATLLPDGTVLVAGGTGPGSVPFTDHAIGSAELYDRLAGTFTSTANLTQSRSAQTATLLPNGKVLIAGGFDPGGFDLGSTEVYDPPVHAFSQTGDLGTARSEHAATLLPNGKVLLAGGTSSRTVLSTAEVYRFW